MKNAAADKMVSIIDAEKGKLDQIWYDVENITDANVYQNIYLKKKAQQITQSNNTMSAFWPTKQPLIIWGKEVTPLKQNLSFR
jgi:hypothetical protein